MEPSLTKLVFQIGDNKAVYGGMQSISAFRVDKFPIWFLPDPEAEKTKSTDKKDLKLKVFMNDCLFDVNLLGENGSASPNFRCYHNVRTGRVEIDVIPHLLQIPEGYCCVWEVYDRLKKYAKHSVSLDIPPFLNLGAKPTFNEPGGCATHDNGVTFHFPIAFDTIVQSHPRLFRNKDLHG
jgi:hypothetical protein